MKLLVFLSLLILFSCGTTTSIKKIKSNTDPDKFALFENIPFHSSSKLKAFVERVNNVNDSNYVKLNKVDGIISGKVLIDKKGKVEEAYLLKQMDSTLNNLVLDAIKTSKFKRLSNSKGFANKYSVLVVYRFVKGEILSPIINGKSINQNDTFNKEMVYEFFGVDEKVKITNKITPYYPKSAKESGIQGTSVISTIIDERGYPIYAEVFKPLNSSLDNSSIDAAMQCEFIPAKDNGKNVKVKMMIPFAFKLK